MCSSQSLGVSISFLIRSCLLSRSNICRSRRALENSLRASGLLGDAKSFLNSCLALIVTGSSCLFNLCKMILQSLVKHFFNFVNLVEDFVR